MEKELEVSIGIEAVVDAEVVVRVEGEAKSVPELTSSVPMNWLPEFCLALLKVEGGESSPRFFVLVKGEPKEKESIRGDGVSAEVESERFLGVLDKAFSLSTASLCCNALSSAATVPAA